jgi:hypothetical protein
VQGVWLCITGAWISGLGAVWHEVQFTMGFALSWGLWQVLHASVVCARPSGHPTVRGGVGRAAWQPRHVCAVGRSGLFGRRNWWQSTQWKSAISWILMARAPTAWASWQFAQTC